MPTRNSSFFLLTISAIRRASRCRSPPTHSWTRPPRHRQCCSEVEMARDWTVLQHACLSCLQRAAYGDPGRGRLLFEEIRGESSGGRGKTSHFSPQPRRITSKRQSCLVPSSVVRSRHQSLLDGAAGGFCAPKPHVVRAGPLDPPKWPTVIRSHPPRAFVCPEYGAGRTLRLAAARCPRTSVSSATRLPSSLAL